MEDLFLNYLQAGASLRGNFEFLLPKMWETRTTPVLVQNCYKIVRKLFSYRAVYFYDRLRTFFRQPSQAYLETSSSWEIFSLQHLGLLHTRVTGYSFGCFIPWRSASMQFRHFPCFGALYGAKFFSTKSSLHGSIVSTTLSVRG